MNAKKQNRIIITISFLLPFIVAMISLRIGHLAPFGSGLILSAGNHNDFIPYVYEYYDHIKEGKNFFFGNTFGLGYDFSTMVSYYFSDPTNLIILCFSHSSIPAVINILYAFKIGLAGFSMSIYLTYKKSLQIKKNVQADNNLQDDDKEHKDFVIGFTHPTDSRIIKFFQSFDWIIIALSCSFALSTTMITVGSYFNYLSAISILPLVIMGLERLIKENKPFYFIIFLFLSIIFSIHISIISVIFLIIYFFTKDFKDIKKFLKSTRLFIISIVSAILMSSIITINSFNGPFLHRDLSNIFPIFSYKNPFNFINQLTSYSPLSYYSNYGNNTDIAFGIGLIILTLAYLFNNNINKSSRYKKLILILFLFSGLFISTSRFLLNGFSSEAGSTIHYSYIIVFIFIDISYELIQNIEEYNTKSIIFAVSSLISIFVLAMIFSDMFESSKTFIISFEFIFFYTILLILYTNKSMTKSLLLLLLSAIICFECVSSYVKNMNIAGNGYTTYSLKSINTYQLYEISRQIHKKDECATVMKYSSETDSILPTNYLFSGYDYIISQTFLNFDNNLISNITDDYTNNSPFTIIIGKTNYNSVGLILDNNIKTYKYDNLHPFTSSNILFKYYLNQDTIFSNVYYDYSFIESSDEEYYNLNIKPYSSGDLYVNFNSIYNYGYVDENNEYSAIFKSKSYSYPDDDYQYEAAVLNNQPITDYFNKATISNPKIKNDLLKNKESHIISNNKGYISTGIAYIKSFNYYINGKKVIPLTIFDENVLLPIESGDNTISIKYSPKYIIISIFLSIIGICICTYITKRVKE